jgi:4-hydroxybenzoate polyprenyltransferase
LAVAGLMAGLGLAYFVGLIVAEGIALHHYNLIKDRNREKCFAAFLHNNWLGAAVFVGLMVSYLLR